MWKIVCFFGGLILCGPVVLAQDAAPLVLTRLNGPIHLDGLSDEPAWQEVPPLPLTTYEPTSGDPPSEPTEIRIAYDSNYLYGSIRAYDTDPDGIRMNSLYRDRLSGDDFFVVLLDTYNDNESAITFTMTPAGVRRDASVSNDATGPGSLNVDFNTFWDLRTAVTDEGWFAEIRIPFSSLRFRNSGDRVVMGLLVQRYIARKNERITFPLLPGSTDRAFIKASLAHKVVLENIHHHRPVYVTPYGLGGMTRAALRNEQAPSFQFDDRVKREAGIDLKYGLSNDLTLDLTVNTDFAQVEADDQQVNLTRFSLFFPEKRQFFQERSGLFEFRTGGESRLFHSRRIGLTDNGQPVRILGGARVVGRAGRWDIGLLDMQTAESESLPSENFGVLRLRRQFLNAYSFAGGMATSRIGADGSYNLAYGLDAVVRFFQDDYLSFKWAQTFDGPESTGLQGGLQTGRLNVDLERRRRQGPGYQTQFVWSGRDYHPASGFTQRNDFTQLDQVLWYTWLPDASSRFIWHSLQMRGLFFFRNVGFELETAEIGPAWEFSFKSGADALIESFVTHESILLPFKLSDRVEVPAGAYTFYRIGGNYSMSQRHLFRTGFGIQTGTFFDGWRTTFSLSPAWNASRHLELSGEYLLNHIRFADRDQQLVAHIFRMRIGTALNTRLSVNTFVQYNSTSDLFSTNLRFRYNFREGQDLWIVYNEGLNTDRDQFQPSLPLSDNRTFIIKYVHTFQF